jgi:choline dehydrogenase-like flavoprotein
MSQHQTYDYIIAGAGSAGCALAARLCEDPDITVCLVEAGGNGNSLFVRMPAGNGFVFGNPRFDWGYESVVQPELNGRTIYYPRGKGLGGTSLLTAMQQTLIAGGTWEFPAGAMPTCCRISRNRKPPRTGIPNSMANQGP